MFYIYITTNVGSDTVKRNSYLLLVQILSGRESLAVNIEIFKEVGMKLS